MAPTRASPTPGGSARRRRSGSSGTARPSWPWRSRSTRPRWAARSPRCASCTTLLRATTSGCGRCSTRRCCSCCPRTTPTGPTSWPSGTAGSSGPPSREPPRPCSITPTPVTTTTATGTCSRSRRRGSRVRHLYHRWHPQIVHDVHQMGPRGARLFVPPYADPWEPNVDGALVAAAGALGSHVASRLTTAGRTRASSPARSSTRGRRAARIRTRTAGCASSPRRPPRVSRRRSR